MGAPTEPHELTLFSTQKLGFYCRMLDSLQRTALQKFLASGDAPHCQTAGLCVGKLFHSSRPSLLANCLTVVGALHWKIVLLVAALFIGKLFDC